jgi:VWFA-related protein
MRWPVALALASAIAVARIAAQPPQPTFRSGTELVRLDVLVTTDKGPVAGLTAADFEVKDSGVVQKVQALSAVASVQLGVVLDVSGSMTGERLAIAQTATIDLLGTLTPSDGFAVVASSDQVARVTAPGASLAEARAALARIRPGGATALVDGIYGGLIEATRSPDPTLLVVMTDGRNNASWLTGASLVDSARRHETVIYPVAVGIPDGWTKGVSSMRKTSDTLALLHVLAEETGGRTLRAEWNRRLGDVFTAILREYRQRYILTFTPEGVGRGDGWHAVSVRVKRRGAKVRARSGYWSDSAPAPAAERP